MYFNETPSMYSITHHNIIEFYHKSNCLFKLKCDKIVIKINDPYEENYRKSQKKWNLMEGGNFEIHMNINNYNKKNLFNIKDNIKTNYMKFEQIDGVVYNLKNIDVNAEMKKIHVGSLKLDHNGFHILYGWFFRYGVI